MSMFGSRGVGSASWPKAMAFVAVAGVTLLACGKPPKNVGDEDHSPPSTSDEPPPKWDTSSESQDNAKHPDIKQNEGSDVPAPPQSQAPKQHRSDEYDKEATETVLNRAARQVKANCGAAKNTEGKATGPWGKVTISVNLGHNGHSKDVTVPPPQADQPAGRCIVQAFSNLTFPPWAGADTSVNWDVELVQPK